MSKRPQSKAKQREREKRARARRKERAKASQPFLSFSGPIVDHECRLDLLLCHPHVDTLNRQAIAIIDTGSTGTAIRRDIADELRLPTIGTTDVHGIHGVKTSDVVLAKFIAYEGNRSVRKTLPMTVGEKGEMRDDMIFGMQTMFGGVLTVDTPRRRWKFVVK